MKRNFILLIFLLLVTGSLFSQERKFSKHGSQVQMDILGPGGMVSFHFESRFLKRNDGLGFKVGMGIAPYGLLEETCNTGGMITIPVGLNYLVGKKNHLLEIGAGFAAKFGGGTKVYCVELEDNFFESTEGVYWYSLLGYRYHSMAKRAAWRVFISPLIQKDLPVKFWGGAGVSLKLGSPK